MATDDRSTDLPLNSLRKYCVNPILGSVLVGVIVDGDSVGVTLPITIGEHHDTFCSTEDDIAVAIVVVAVGCLTLVATFQLNGVVEFEAKLEVAVETAVFTGVLVFSTGALGAKKVDDVDFELRFC